MAGMQTYDALPDKVRRALDEANYNWHPNWAWELRNKGLTAEQVALTIRDVDMRLAAERGARHG